MIAAPVKQSTYPRPEIALSPTSEARRQVHRMERADIGNEDGAEGGAGVPTGG